VDGFLQIVPYTWISEYAAGYGHCSLKAFFLGPIDISLLDLEGSLAASGS
jgi:hypothetical protein